MESIGKYRLLRVLGRGGMGTVYEALDPVINRKVALKTMIQGLAESPDLRARFLREAQAAGGLRHRNIVTVYELVEDRDQPFIAMEFIEGTDLEKIIQNREPLSIEWKLDVIRQICDGLGCAHKSGIVHRDIKPANIRVTPEGEVKIMDFGIAHLQSSTMTKSGLVLGTVHYMAPEQVEGHKVDHRADIFSVGAIAFELIAYKKPFEGDSITAVMFKITHEEPARDQFPKTDYSPGLERIVMRALAREVARRYATLDEMHEDLERVVRDAAPRLMERSAAAPPAGAPRGVGIGETVARLTAARLTEEASRYLDASNPEKALESARKALAAAPGDAETQALVRRAEHDALRTRVEKETGEIRAELNRARAQGQLQKALGLCRRLLELNPEDSELTRASSEIQAAIQDGEVEQLCGMALGYAADGDMDLALKIAEKIERIDPKNPRYQKLRTYIEDERARRAAEALTGTSKEHLALGNLAEAWAAAEEALAACPSYAPAREVKDNLARVLPPKVAEREAPASPHPEAAAPPPEAAGPPPEALTPLPEGPPSNPEAAALLETARRLLRERSPQKALPLLERAAAFEPSHQGLQRILGLTRTEARREEVESLTTAALDHFVQSDHPKARKAVEKALALDPENRKARELLKILGALG